MAREALRQKHPDLAEMAEEINPFTSENMVDMVTIIDDLDLRKHNQYSELTLVERYEQGMETIRRASPPLPDDMPSVTMRADKGAKADTISNRLADK